VTPAGTIDEFRPQVRPALAHAQLEGELAVYDPQAQEMLVLNQSAQAVWSCCDGTGTVAEIVADIVDVFGAEAGAVKGQVCELVADWSRRGLLVTPAPGPQASTSPSDGPGGAGTGGEPD
jgi:hypothetical protein